MNHCPTARNRYGSSILFITCSFIGWLMIAASLQASTLVLLDGEVLFEENQAHPSALGEHSLESLVQSMQEFEGILSIRIIGHSDETGDSRRARLLSQRRAFWVRQYLETRFPRSHILSLGAGDAMPQTEHDSVAARARNRRVQIQVIASGNAPQRN